MILLVLLHKGKGSGLSDLFGGGVSSNYGGSSVVERNLDRLTIVVGGLWFGAGPMGEAERGDQIERATVSYWCANGHEVRPSFAVEETVVIPAEWDCPKCGLPAGRDRNNPPSAVVNIPYKTHLAYVKERRTDTEGAKILEDALRKLRGDDLD
jgi:protein translocase SecG subunit